jgi:glycosyltransferase involved in cell wall biosynthesis
MRLLIASLEDTEIGGVASVVSNLARYLRDEGHEIYFLYPGRTLLPKERLSKDGFPTIDLRMQVPFGKRNPIISVTAFLLLLPITLFQLLRFLCEKRIQVINVHYPSDWYFYLAICRRLLSIKMVNSIHGAEIFPDGKRPLRYSPLLKFLLSASDYVTAPSNAFANQFLSIFPDLKTKTTHIHNGVNASDFTLLPKDSRSSFLQRYILTVTTCKIQKGVDILLRAFRRVHEVDSDLRLVICGDGPMRYELEELARSLHIADVTDFVGDKGREDVINLLHGCELFVMPSRFETFGIAILEAWACRKAVVATTAGGIPEVVEDRKNGVLVQPDNPAVLAEALIDVLQNQHLRATLAQNGYATVRERFSRENTGSAYEAIFANLLNSQRTHTPAERGV